MGKKNDKRAKREGALKVFYSVVHFRTAQGPRWPPRINKESLVARGKTQRGERMRSDFLALS